MRVNDKNRNVLAGALIALGVLMLAGNLGWLSRATEWVWAALFIVGGMLFLRQYRIGKGWWALIPGFALLALGVQVLVGGAGALFLALLGVGFLALYVTENEQWWAIIPGGALLTLALVSWSSPQSQSWLLFLGFGLTFGALTRLPGGKGRQEWAIYPAVILLVVAAVAFVSSSTAGIAVPLVMIALGAYLLWRRGSGEGGQKGTSDANQPPAEGGDGVVN